MLFVVLKLIKQKRRISLTVAQIIPYIELISSRTITYQTGKAKVRNKSGNKPALGIIPDAREINIYSCGLCLFYWAMICLW